MSTVAVNPPKTPVTKGSQSLAIATMPNVCKMPGPPAPFVPTPLPNIGQSEKNPQGYSTSVKIEGQTVGIAGATFDSTGDIASKGTGGGIASNNAEGPTKFLGPGSMNVQIEGKNVQFLGDQMLNNCGPGGSPPNAATMAGVIHLPAMPLATPEEFLQEVACRCDQHHDNNHDANGKPLSCMKAGSEKHECCDEAIRRHQASGQPPKVGGEEGYVLNGNQAQQVSPPSRAALFKAGKLPKGSLWPDASSLGPNGQPTQLFDFKFKCKSAKYKGPPKWSKRNGKDQFEQYKNLSIALGIDIDKNPPKIIHNGKC